MSDKRTYTDYQSGNAMIYVLIALALFGALTLTLSSQNEQADGQDLSDEQAEFYAMELIEYAASTKNVIDQMRATGTDIDELDFINPASAGFDSPPHIHKVYHPQGGGLNYLQLDTSSPIIVNNGNTNQKVSLGRFNNFEWTPSTANDVVLSFYQIEPEICEVITRKITGSSDLPAISGIISQFFIDALSPGHNPGTNLDLTNAICSDCVGYPSLCIKKANDTTYTFYSIVAAQ